MKAFTALLKTKVMRVLSVMVLTTMIVIGAGGAQAMASTTASEAATNCATAASNLASMAVDTQRSDGIKASALSQITSLMNGQTTRIFGSAVTSTDRHEDKSFTCNGVTYIIGVYANGIADCDAKTSELSTNYAALLAGNTTSADINGAQTQITNIMGNTRADLTKAQTTLSGLHDFIEIVLGLVCYAAILLMAVFTGFDIVAIILPGARSKLDGVAQKGGAMSRESKSTGEAKFVFITDDCMDALKEASETGKKPMLLYLKKRVISYIAIAVVIYMLMTGNIGLFVNLALKAISGFMDTLSDIASTT